MAETFQHINETLLKAELLGTLEAMIIYCNNENVKQQASERYSYLLGKFGEKKDIPPLGNFTIKNKFICQPQQKKQSKK